MQHPVTTPPAPERVRSLAALSAPTHVAIAGTPVPAGPARGGVDSSGRPVLLIKPGDPLYAAGEETVVTVDLVATRTVRGSERARGMLKVQGWLQSIPAEELREAAITIAERCPDEDLFTVIESAPGPRLVRVDVAQVVYLTGQESGVLDAEEYLAAAADPFLDAAERMIHHVNSAHREQLVQAISLLLKEPVPGAWLWELDRFGATVRAANDRLIRMPWPAPATTPDALEHALACLMCGH